jgi:hypothetical protein
MKKLRNLFRNFGKRIKRLGSNIGRAFKKTFKKVGGFFAKLGPIGTMALMFIAPYVLGPMMAGISGATGLGTTSGTIMGQAGAGAAEASAAIASAQGVSGAVAKTMFSVGKTLGTVGKTVTGALEGTLNILGGGSATGFQLGSSIAEGAKWVASSAKTLMDAPGKILEEVLPGDTSWLSAKRDELLGEPLFTTSGELRAVQDPLKTGDFRDWNETGLERRAAPVTPVDTAEAVLDRPRQEIKWETTAEDIAAVTPDVSYTDQFLEAQQMKLPIQQYPSPPQPSLLTQVSQMPRQAYEWAARVPANLIEKPINTTLDLKAKATLARQAKNFFDPPAIPKPYGGYGGPGTALALDQLALSNLDYANMQPEQIGQEDTVYTGLLSNDQAYDSALMDVLGKNMMYGLYTT